MRTPSVSVRGAGRAGIEQDFPVRLLAAGGADGEGQYAARLAARFHDVELLLVGREGEAVGGVDVFGYDGRRAALRVDAIDVHRQFRLGDFAFVIAEDAEARIGEPDRAVGFHHHVVG